MRIKRISVDAAIEAINEAVNSYCDVDDVALSYSLFLGNGRIIVVRDGKVESDPYCDGRRYFPGRE